MSGFPGTFQIVPHFSLSSSSDFTTHSLSLSVLNVWGLGDEPYTSSEHLEARRVCLPPPMGLNHSALRDSGHLVYSQVPSSWCPFTQWHNTDNIIWPDNAQSSPPVPLSSSGHSCIFWLNVNAVAGAIWWGEWRELLPPHSTNTLLVNGAQTSSLESYYRKSTDGGDGKPTRHCATCQPQGCSPPLTMVHHSPPTFPAI